MTNGNNANNKSIIGLQQLSFNNNINIQSSSANCKILTNLSGDLDITTDGLTGITINNNGVGSSMKFSNGINIIDISNSIIGTNNLTLTSSLGSIGLISNNDNINLTASNGNAIITSTGIQLNASDYITLTATNDFMTLHADDDITLKTFAGNIQLTTINDGINYFGKVFINKATSSTGDGEIHLTTITSPSDIFLQTGGVGVAQITSGDNVQLYCGENFTVQTNTTSGLVSFTTGGNLANGGMKWNNYIMPMSFTTLIDNGSFFSFKYPNGNPLEHWVKVYIKNVTIPPNFSNAPYKITFDMNFFSVGSGPSDKQIAMYWVVTDINGNEVKGYNFSRDQPWANWFNTSQYSPLNFISPMPVCYSDYYDLTSLTSNDLQLQLWWWASQVQDQQLLGTIEFIPTNLLK